MRKREAILIGFFSGALFLTGIMVWKCVQGYLDPVEKIKEVVEDKAEKLQGRLKDSLQDMTTSDKGLDLIRRFEGLLEKEGEGFKSYLCPAGVWTICWGHTKGVVGSTKASLAKCKDIFEKDITDTEKIVKDNVNVVLTQNQFDAIVSFVFNVGPTNFVRSSVLRHINQKNYNKVPERLSLWDNAYVGGKLVPLKGLTRRRKAEGDMFAIS